MLSVFSCADSITHVNVPGVITLSSMKAHPRISESEWQVMKVLWARSPASAGDIIESPGLKGVMHPQTVKTLLNRLIKKRALGFKKDGRAYLYFPRVEESECLTATSESFLDRVFGGSLKPMLAHFIEHDKLSAAEIGELKRLLDKKEK